MPFLVRNWFYKESLVTHKLILLIFFLALSSEIMAKGLVLSKYQNSVLLIYDTINLKSERITIPVNSNVIYAALNLRVNSCSLLENNGYEFIRTIEAGIKISNTIEVKKHLELHSHKQYHNTNLEEGYWKIKLIECNNDDKIIINDIQG